MKKESIIGIIVVIVCAMACRKELPEMPDPVPPIASTTPLEVTEPSGFPNLNIPTNNPMTVEGVALGRRLFYDPILSADSTAACASCHKQDVSFCDDLQFSEGVNSLTGNMNAPAIINAGWNSSHFWDGRAETLEAQALGPVTNPIEMNLPWAEAEKRLNRHSEYPELFRIAYGIENIDSMHVAKAIAQFERTLISGNSRYDEFLASDLEPIQFFTPEEFEGYVIFFTEQGDCFHCHGTILGTDNEFHNNGLDENPDLGRKGVTGNSFDEGKFKTPTLRNIEFTAPYMHDGRFETLEEVMEFYSFGVQQSTTIDPLMKKAHQGGIQLSASERQNLIAFLKTFSESEFNTNPDFSSPF